MMKIVSGGSLHDCLIGTCSECGQPMLCAGVDAWHPYDTPNPCPPEVVNRQKGGLVLPLWGRTGRPGLEYFRLYPHCPWPRVERSSIRTT